MHTVKLSNLKLLDVNSALCSMCGYALKNLKSALVEKTVPNNMMWTIVIKIQHDCQSNLLIDRLHHHYKHVV